MPEPLGLNCHLEDAGRRVRSWGSRPGGPNDERRREPQGNGQLIQPCAALEVEDLECRQRTQGGGQLIQPCAALEGGES